MLLKIMSTIILTTVISVFVMAGSQSKKGAGCVALFLIIMLLFVLATIWIL